MRASIIAMAALLAGCCTPRVVTEYKTVEVVREVYVPINAELTNPHHIAEGPLSACPDVAAARAAELRRCNLDKQAIREVEGGPVPEPR